VARQAGISDFNRIGIFNPTTIKTIKDRRAKIGDDADVVKAKELLVKDLGM
jgi:very-long-chain enoyl-CoA reductase